MLSFFNSLDGKRRSLGSLPIFCPLHVQQQHIYRAITAEDHAQQLDVKAQLEELSFSYAPVGGGNEGE